MTGVAINGNFLESPQHVKEIITISDFVIGEDKKNTLRLLAASQSRGKKYFLLNEHSNFQDKKDLVDCVKKVNSVVLFSDAGTPCVADPGFDFVDMCYKNGIEVFSIPGPSSITTAISVSGFYAENFCFLGYPPRNDRDRSHFRNKIRKNKQTLVIFERPYALKNCMVDLRQIDRRLSISFNLGMHNEKTIRGYIDDIEDELEDMPKSPFVIVIEGEK